ncbi:SusC/RagA family TonB-linked outer membrane protein [Agriterribacter humi]|jgi:TonB-linked SusC/RagA family outer membrane protein|uniref:SusC/RagA family TonB-linked outer membrane protein n=1 Tax=Agriterribacter humi TaxID=1104781 RepID=UPI0012652904|nr:TonB-dependent receptor [Agriterribacter humi]
MKMKIALQLCIVFLLHSLTFKVFSQSLQISGKVTSRATGESLPGATVSIKDGSASVITDAQGSFTITVPKSGSILVVTYAGMVSLERVITNGGVQNFELETGGDNLEEVVVVGYGTQKKTSLTASVSSVKGGDIQRQPVGDLTNALGGRASGVLFTQASGQAGNDASRIMIRGIGTNGNSAPLIIVDGVPRNFSQLNPADIETINVLKDAAAVAPYGLGGANGVILVTTKKGKTGKPTLSYEGYVGFQNPTVIPRFVNSYQYALMKNEGARNAGSTEMPFDENELQKYRDGSDPDKYPNIDPVGDMISKNTLITSHSLTLNGGTEAIKYAMGLGYLNQEGMFPGIKYQRYNVSASLQAQATKTTTIDLSLNGRVEKRDLTGAGYNNQSLFENLINTVSNSTPLIYSNGLHPYMYAYFYDNPSYQDITGNTLLSQLSIEQKLPVKGLSLKFVGSYDFNPFDPFNTTNSGIASVTRAWYEPFPFYTVDTTTNPYTYPLIAPSTLPSFSQEYHQTQAFTYQGYINYSGNFGNHDVTGLVVLESRNTTSQRFSAGRNNYNLPIPELFAGGSGETDLSNDGNSMGTKQRSVVYRVTYGYNDKYLFEAAGRYDGHYFFAPGRRFGFFPAFSAAWRLSQEKFMENIKWIDELKLRGSWGQSANLAGSPYQYQTGFTLYGNSAILNGSQTQGLYERAEPNPNITWEKASKTDIGIEARLFGGLLNIEADYFKEKRANMLLAPNVTVPVEYGVDLSQVNAGIMDNRGFEFTVSSGYNINNDLRVGVTGNFTYVKNKMVEIFEDPATFDNPNLRKTGRSLDVPFGYKATGYFTEGDFSAPGVLKDGIAKQVFTQNLYPGDIRYADISGPDGKPDGLIDFNDQVAMGYPTYPAIIYGFTPSISWKGFELSLLFQGVGQRDIQISSSAAWAFDNNKNAAITTLDYWTPENPNASYPRMTTTPSANNVQTSTFWQRSVAYLRLRTGMLSYTIPNSITSKWGMSMVSVYLSGQNIITWTPIENFDPEVSNGRGWYFPTQKALTAGLRVQF